MAALFEGLGLPGSRTAGWLTGLAVAFGASSPAARRAQRAKAAETLLPRRPQQLDLADAPAPDRRALRRNRGLDAAALEPSHVTVLGVTGEGSPRWCSSIFDEPLRG